jgi:hypothetical protein
VPPLPHGLKAYIEISIDITEILCLKLRSLNVFHAGETTFSMNKKIRAVVLSRLLLDIKPLA